MTHHPCDGHGCDHCYICDTLGICCGTVPGAQRQILLGAAPPSNGLAELRKALDTSGPPRTRQLTATTFRSPTGLPTTKAAGELPSGMPDKTISSTRQKENRHGRFA